MVELNVELGPASYKINIGTDWISNLKNCLPQKKFSTNALIISDFNVAPIYADEIIKVLNSAGFSPTLYSVKPGELSKSASCAIDLYTKAIEHHLDRKSPIIALGGGVVGDLAGFIAATYLRGVPFIQIPTTLLAQVDSSVGGKVAINHPLGKNLIGAFYQPELVFIDTKFLNTLPDRELYTGLAEVIKYGVIADCEFFKYLIQDCNDILIQKPHAITKIIQHSCKIKAAIVAADEHETGQRAILNFGHTIAHAIEAYTNFEKYNHGEAVAIGMHGAALISHRLGLCSAKVVEQIRSCIAKFRLPLKAEDCPAENILPLLIRDKKVVNGKLNWILVKELGQVSIVNNVPNSVVERALAEIT